MISSQKKIIKKKLVAVFIDKVAEKNKLQIEIMHEIGFNVAFFVNEYRDIDNKYFSATDVYQKLATKSIYRILQVINFYLTNIKSIHHVEIYPGGRFAFIYLILARLILLKTICVERGDMLYYKYGGYDKITRLSMWFCYKFSHVVWYRETYMKYYLNKMNVKKMHFIHNAVEKPMVKEMDIKSYEDKDIDFLWLNRIIPERKSEWFVNILQKSEFIHTKNIIAGMVDKTLFQEHQKYLRVNTNDNLQIIDYVENPIEFYLSSKFFVLPARVVFANNSLLEAMSLGVVPIVTKSPGVDEIVRNGFTGFISDYTQDSFENAMVEAIHLNKTEYQRMSDAAKLHVQRKFSRDYYKSGILKLYSSVYNT